MNSINIGLIGLGTVGGGVVELIQKNNLPINIVAVADKNKNRLKDLGLSTDLFCDIDKVIANPNISTIVELIGGINPARDIIARALNAGKNVVTANKDLISLHGAELADIACRKNVNLLYEASCLGAIPIINVLENRFLGDNIQSIKGIFNGTTNFILSKMKEEKMDFKTALSQAQELGYAEANPKNDIEGIDAAYKLSILSRLAFDASTSFENINVQGIANVTAADIEIARKLNYTIKLIASGRRNGQGSLELRVNPAFVADTHPLASVGGCVNAITIDASHGGENTLIGRGAGSHPTASSVVSDILKSTETPCKCDPLENVTIATDYSAKFAVRLSVPDIAGAMAGISGVFGNHDISIDESLQIKHSDGDKKTYVAITHPTSRKNLDSALSELITNKTVASVDSVIEVI
jgi:homoserine dehydrogenase